MKRRSDRRPDARRLRGLAVLRPSQPRPRGRTDERRSGGRASSGSSSWARASSSYARAAASWPCRPATSCSGMACSRPISRSSSRSTSGRCMFPRDRVLALCPRLAELEALPSPRAQRPGTSARALHERARPGAAPGSSPLPASRPPTPPSSCCARRSSRACRRPAPRPARRCAPRSAATCARTCRIRRWACLDRPRVRDVGARAARPVRGCRRVGGRARAERAAGPLHGGPAAAQRRLGHRDRLPLGLLRRRSLLARVQARLRRRRRARSHGAPGDAAGTAGTRCSCTSRLSGGR